MKLYVNGIFDHLDSTELLKVVLWTELGNQNNRLRWDVT